ncbi:Ubiquitin carboxyl-terminal hydrolase 37 [Chamberlinius hualienensis]
MTRHATEGKCYGDAKIYSSTRRTRRILGYLEVVRRYSGIWMMVLHSGNNKLTYDLTFPILSNLSDRFCENNRLYIKFSDDDVLDFRARLPYRDNLVDIGNKLQQLKNETNFSKNVHDMYTTENAQNRHKPVTNSRKRDLPVKNLYDDTVKNPFKNDYHNTRKTFVGFNTGSKMHQKYNSCNERSSPKTYSIPNRSNGSGSSYLTPLKENVSADHSFTSSNNTSEIKSVKMSPFKNDRKSESFTSDRKDLKFDFNSPKARTYSTHSENSDDKKRKPDLLMPESNGDSDEENKQVTPKKSTSFVSDGDNQQNLFPNGVIESKTHPPSRFYRRSYISPSISRLSLRDNNRISRFQPNSGTVKRPILLVSENTAKKSRLSPEIENKENEGDQHPSLPLGFPNLGNTCYINSVLQALYMAISNCNTCETTFMNCYHRLVNKLSGQHLFKYFWQIMEMSKQPTTGNSDIKRLLKSFKQSLEEGKKSFEGDRMQDAHEFLTALFDLITDELGKGSPNSKAESTAVQSVIDSYFKSTVTTVTKCTGCNHESPIQETFYNFGVNIPDKEKTLQSSLHLSFTSEMERNCENCTCKKSTQTLQFVELPRILIIYVKRYNGSSKIETKLRVPKYLSVDQIAADSASLSTLVEYKTGLDDSGSSSDTGYQSEAIYSNESTDKPDAEMQSNGENLELENNWNVPDDEEDEDLKRAKEASLEEYNQQFLSIQTKQTDDVGILFDDDDPPLSPEATGDEKNSYRLISYVCHEGNATEIGHYVAYTGDCKQKKYFSLSDEIVRVVSEDSFIKIASSAYILMYIHKDVCLESVTNSASRFTQPFNSR